MSSVDLSSNSNSASEDKVSDSPKKNSKSRLSLSQEESLYVADRPQENLSPDLVLPQSEHIEDQGGKLLSESTRSIRTDSPNNRGHHSPASRINFQLSLLAPPIPEVADEKSGAEDNDEEIREEQKESLPFEDEKKEQSISEYSYWSEDKEEEVKEFYGNAEPVANDQETNRWEEKKEVLKVDRDFAEFIFESPRIKPNDFTRHRSKNVKDRTEKQRK